MKTYAFLLILIIKSISIPAQPTAEELKKLSNEVFPSSMASLRSLLSIPNNGLYPNDVLANMLWCEDAFQQRGFTVQRLPTKGAPLLLASWFKKEKLPTLLVYLHVDGQPVDSSKWQQSSPYKPVIKTKNEASWDSIPWPDFEQGYDPDWRIFARSSSDDKGPIMMLLAAMDVMNNHKWSPGYNIKVIMDFEEELGSPHLPAAVVQHKDALAADMLIILDGPRHQNNQPTLTFGARGISTITLKVFGPRTSLHSGHYGNYAPNPALKMSQLLATMKDSVGRVSIPGFYDSITLDEGIKAKLKKVPDDEEVINQMLGIAKPDQVGTTLQEALQYPSLNIRGLKSGWVGNNTRTIIPSEAIAEIDIRLVKESDGSRLVNLVKSHIASHGYHFVKGEPTDEERAKYPNLIAFTYHNAYGAFRTDFESEIGIFLERALQRAFISPPIKLRTTGGSVPIAPFITALNVPAVIVPTVNSDNNQHSPNENLRLGNFMDGIRTFLGILTEPMPR